MTPPDGDSVLSQDDIDSLVSSASEETSAPKLAPLPVDHSPPPEAPPAAPAVASAAGSGPMPPAASAGGAELADIARRVAKLEVAIARVGQAGGVDGQVKARIISLTKHVQLLKGQVAEISSHLPTTVGYRAAETFQCQACGTTGLVASRVMCTHCGQETWIGWWPQS